MPSFPLKLNPSGVISLTAVIAGPLDRKVVPLVLDTGASLTSISYESALLIGVDPTKSKERVAIFTASGQEIVPVILIPSFTILGFTIRNLRVICLTLPVNSGADGLLGMDILGRFRVTLDVPAGMLTVDR